MKRTSLLKFLGLSLFLAFASCARQGYPTGGPKDETPPRPLASQPQNESRHFNSRQFYIQFDEYVVLKNAAENVLISPPLKYKPEYSTKGRGVLVKIQDTLLPNTTYLFQFKEAVADFTEGNPLPSFEYVFSTGADLDTMMLGGTVKSARNGQPWKETVTVVAYADSLCTHDTLATSVQPSFVTRCDKEGRFAFHYLPAGRYRLVAFEDKNRNLRLDLDDPAAWHPAFHSSLDSLDSSALVHLLISAPDTRKQRITSSEFIDKGVIRITTAAPMQSPQVIGADGLWRLNPQGDTLTFWLARDNIDTARLAITDFGIQDTLRLRYRPKSPDRTTRRGRSQPTTKPLMKALCQGTSAFYDDLRLAFENPIVKIADSAKARITHKKDSVVTLAPLTLDSTGLQARIEAILESGETYSIHIAKGLFTDLRNNLNDSLTFDLTPKDFGTLTLHIDNQSGSPLVLEVLDKKDTIMQSLSISTSGKLQFHHLPEGEYHLRAIFDIDGNSRWTAGDYRLQRQPEQAVLFDKTFQLRERWEMEERWTVTKPEE